MRTSRPLVLLALPPLAWMAGWAVAERAAWARPPAEAPPLQQPAALTEPAADEPAADDTGSEPRATDETTSSAPTRSQPTATPRSEDGSEPTSTATPSTTDPAATPEPATPVSTPTADGGPVAPAPTATPPAAEPKRGAILPTRTHPRLVLAGGPLVGPHAIGNEECDVELARCETKGSFLGLGGQLELRGRLWRLLYLHARGVVVGNVSPNDRIYRGVAAAGVGLGLYGRRVFGRGEYLYVGAFGDNHFEPPFFDGEVASDEWGHHAGMLSVGFRQPLPHRLAVELWGGLVIGPRSVRRVPQVEPDERVLTTFLVGLDLSWDVWQ